MSYEIATADNQISNLVRVGKIHSVDPATSSAIVDFGDFKSPALQVGQLTGGAIQFWCMPSVGEQVMVFSESGDLAQGKIFGSIYASNAPSADGAVPMINLAGGKMIIDGTLEVTGDVIANGVSLVHHTHSGIVSGPDNTGEPNK